MKYIERCKQLERENQLLKKRIKELEHQLPPYTLTRLEKIKWLKDQGFGLRESLDAINIFNDEPYMALQYLIMKGDAVCRKNKKGKPWDTQDYIEYITKVFGEK